MRVTWFLLKHRMNGNLKHYLHSMAMNENSWENIYYNWWIGCAVNSLICKL